jgi:23S rRNA pseudouridine1911/1915/1917 synthase
LYENDRCIVFDKPAGLLVIPSPRKEKYTLESIVNEQYAPGDGSWQLHPCHRLDQDTSGCILFAKGKRNQQLLMELFRTRRIKKSYFALAQGRINRMSGTINSPVESLESRRFKNRQLKPAVTKYRVLIRKKQFSIVEVEPVTGRSNQIRIHFTQIGHPLLGERKYAFAKDFKLRFRRTALHARTIQWNDPVDHSRITVEAPLPKDMEVFIANHRN